jgi:uncharacterized protein (TIGR03643 family)
MTKQQQLDETEVSRVIEMAWEDRTPFEAIERLFNVNEAAVIVLMRQHLKLKAFKNWRQRVSGRKSKHLKLRSPEINRAYCSSQYKPMGSRQ